MNRAGKRESVDWRWTAAIVMGTPLTLLIISGWAGMQLNPHGLSILIVPLAVLSGIAAIPIGGFWLVSIGRREGSAALASPAILAYSFLILINAASVAYALPRMRW